MYCWHFKQFGRFTHYFRVLSDGKCSLSVFCMLGLLLSLSYLQLWMHLEAHLHQSPQSHRHQTACTHPIERQEDKRERDSVTVQWQWEQMVLHRHNPEITPLFINVQNIIIILYSRILLEYGRFIRFHIAKNLTVQSPTDFFYSVLYDLPPSNLINDYQNPLHSWLIDTQVMLSVARASP